MYDKEYYKSVNYTDYLARGDRYKKLASEVLNFLDKMNLAEGPVLDFGCAVGFLLEELQKKLTNCYGVEVSEYCIEECKKKGLEIHHEPVRDMRHGIVFSLDVFEHMQEEELETFIKNIETKVIVFRIPICREGESDYVLDVSRRDPTHVIRWSKNKWKKYFESFGYKCVDLNLLTIYNSEGVYSGLAMKLD